MRVVLPQAQKKGLALTAALPTNVGVVVSDQRRVEQILLNLLSNAIKFTEHGDVRIECRVHAGWLETRVHDTGIGIHPPDLEQLFLPFRQLETGLNRRHEGTGLGLAICKNLVSLLGGEIHAESAWGVGSTFTFTLPLHAEGESHDAHPHH
jgi:signal transduction histidine kinase